ncbi:hypothetical protein CF8_1548, partial [Nocardioides sp. CF8]
GTERGEAARHGLGVLVAGGAPRVEWAHATNLGSSAAARHLPDVSLWTTPAQDPSSTGPAA